ncbi:MAG: transposase [Phycisphaerae bacterium]|nr:transposase [Phycisphaerae bacterium]
MYHLVFSTKGRRQLLHNGVRARTHEYLGGAVRNENGIALVVNGTADRVHILARLRQDKAISDILRNIKSNSSGWIHKTFPGLPTFAWQAGYGAFTVSRPFRGSDEYASHTQGSLRFALGFIPAPPSGAEACSCVRLALHPTIPINGERYSCYNSDS